MPRPSTRQDLLGAVDEAALSLAQLQYQQVLEARESNSDSSSNSNADSNSDSTMDITSSPTLSSSTTSEFLMSPMTLMISLHVIIIFSTELQRSVMRLQGLASSTSQTNLPHVLPSCTYLFITRNTALTYFARSYVLTLSFLTIFSIKSLIIKYFSTNPIIPSFPFPSSLLFSSIVLATMAMRFLSRTLPNGQV